MTNEELDHLWELARKASPSPWLWAKTPTRTRLGAAWWMLKSIFKGKSGRLWGVLIGDPDGENWWVCVTGNGSQSEANAEYLAAVEPKNIRTLIDAVVYERQRADGLRVQLEYLHSKEAP